MTANGIEWRHRASLPHLANFTVMNNFWEGLAATASAVQAIVVVIAAVYAFMQVRESRRSSDLASLTHLYAQIDSDSAREDRRRLHNELPSDLTKELTADQYALLYRVVGTFNFLGDLIANNLIDFELVACSHARPISRNWQRLEPWVRQQREHEAKFAAAFELLGAKCLGWDRLRNGENVAIPYRHPAPPAAE